MASLGHYGPGTSSFSLVMPALRELPSRRQQSDKELEEFKCMLGHRRPLERGMKDRLTRQSAVSLLGQIFEAVGQARALAWKRHV